MSENNPKDTFVWTAYGDQMPFALDYTQEEVEKLWKINRLHISKGIVDYEIFQDFFLWMRYSNGQNINNEMYERKGLPAELEPFLKIYLQEARKPEYCKSIGKGAMSSEFVQHLCRVLHKNATAEEEKRQPKDHQSNGLGEHEISSSTKDQEQHDSAPDNLFWYRRLYENNEFQRSLSQEYWENEYQWRCDMLRELSICMPHEVQIQQLKRAVCNMDAQIGAMLYIIDRDNLQPPGEQYENYLQTFPKELISKLRKRECSNTSANSRASYRVRNIKITSTQNGKVESNTLESYFNKIRSNKNVGELRKEIRPYYLHDVCEVPEKTVFQRQCEDLQKYLDVYSVDRKPEEEMYNYIVKRCKTYYEPLLWGGMVPSGTIQPGVDRENNLAIVIDESISSIYSTFILQHKDTIEQVLQLDDKGNIEEQCSTHKEYITQLCYMGHDKIALYKCCADWYTHLITTLWDEGVFGAHELLKAEMSRGRIETLAADMATICKDVYWVFGGMAYDWMNATYFVSLWCRYNEIITVHDGSVPPAFGWEGDVHLLKALLACRIWEESNRTAKAVYGSYTALAAYLSGKKDGSQ